jgi:hypothetical protein
METGSAVHVLLLTGMLPQWEQASQLLAAVGLCALVLHSVDESLDRTEKLNIKFG